MMTIRFQSRFTASEDKTFAYAHNARTHLLLAGYLPTEDDSVYVNVYTAEIATLERV